MGRIEMETEHVENHNIKFTHLHVHTEYSLLDGSSKIKELISRTKELGMDSIAITDHGVMYGVIDFYKEAVKQGIKPIIGCEVYVALRSRFGKEAHKDAGYYHLVLLAENRIGYQNLIKIVSAGFIEGFYYKPRIDLDLLREYHEGLIGLSACLAGPVAKQLRQHSYEKAKETAQMYEEILGKGNFYLELQDHGMQEQKAVNQQLVRMSAETHIPLVCTNDIHYIYKEDSKAHDILLCIQTAKTVDDEDRMRYEGAEYYLKSPKEMLSCFPYAKQALENTYKIASRCNIEFTFNELKLPQYDVPEGASAVEYLRNLCNKGLRQRYRSLTQEIEERLAYELSVIEGMGFVDYFLIVWDFIKHARDQGIMVGPGRGSAAGSIVAYCLRITDIDPIQYGLLFERFLNPERISMPDIDIDFCYERRQEVIDYVIEKYGSDHVAQIITFGTMAARGAIRDVGRALNMSYAEVDKVAKMIPTELGITIQKAVEMNPELRDYYEAREEIKYLIDMSRRLEGLPRHSSTHAAGVVISKQPVVEYVPLNANDGVITTQFPMNTLEELGLLKMDFLGLRTLTVIQNAVKEIKRSHGIHINMDTLNFEDPRVYQLIAEGKTEGIFQLESSGMKQFMKELAPQNLEDVIAGISLYRPGPMDFIPKYIRGKNNPQDIQYAVEALRPILETTYGCIVYQEQVMEIVRKLAGYSLGRSDLVRRAMSKKKTEVMEEERKNFIYGKGEEVPGCIKNGIDIAVADHIFDEMTDFAKYAFNKSHAAAYAVIAYQTAWLKTYYPIEFMAALLTSIMDSSSKVSEYIEECRKIGISLLPPDINEGYAEFSVTGDKIRYGLTAIKNVGRNAIQGIVRERSEKGSFASLTDFCERMAGGDINKRCIESLIKAGALDSLGGKRIQYMSIYKQILDGIGQSKKRNIEGQINLFDFGGDGQEIIRKDELPSMEEYPMKQLLAMEKEVVGIYISGHPLGEYEEELRQYISASSLDFIQDFSEEAEQKIKFVDGQEVVIGGIVAAKSIKYTRSNKMMAFVKLEDLYGTVEVIIFPNIYEKYGDSIEEEAVLLISGRVSIQEEEDGKLIANKMSTMDEVRKKKVMVHTKNHPVHKEKVTLWLKISEGMNEEVFTKITAILQQYPGTTRVGIFDVVQNTKFYAHEHLRVSVEDRLIQVLISLLGEGCVVVQHKATSKK